MAIPLKDIVIPENSINTLLLDKHINFLLSYEKNKDDYFYIMSEHIRLSGVYWCCTALRLTKHLDKVNRKEIIDFVLQCQDKSGGFGASVNYDPHILFTLSAVQILILLDALERIDKEAVCNYILSLQNSDGSFCGDEWGEVDSRFSFCSVATLSLLNMLDKLDFDKISAFILSCLNYDGGFGSQPGSESHSGQVYCCIGALSIINKLHFIDIDALGWWLCERQLKSGGLNGRPEKLPDVCYSWWVLASLKMIDKLHWVNKDKVVEFILACQDGENGGFSDRPGNVTDPFHTLFAFSGLSLLKYDSTIIEDVDAIFCLPKSCIPFYVYNNCSNKSSY